MLSRRLGVWRGAAVVICLLVTAAAGGCRSSTSGTQPVVVALTASLAEPAPALPASIVSSLTTFADQAQQVGDLKLSVLVAGASTPDTFDLTPYREHATPAAVENSSETIRQREITQHLSDLSDKLLRETAEQDGLDLLNLLDRSSRVYGQGSIDVISSGLQTADPLDFRKLGWDYDPEKVTKTLQQAGNLPNLTGLSVSFIGLGQTSGSQPTLSIAERAKVTDLWLDICKSAGAKSCTATGTVTEALPLAVRPVPVITVGTTATPCSAPLSLSSDVLFAGDSYDLLRSADAQLDQVASTLKACPSAVAVSLVGHTANVDHGTATQWDKLSQDRANSVYQALVARGVPAQIFTSVTGVGDTQPLVNNWVNGVFVDALASQNRRVEITFTQQR